ncbi:unnamed protein product [Trichobilharzia szidati]|nr:unnamed protein product [Trichobilharzia szidati]
MSADCSDNEIIESGHLPTEELAETATAHPEHTILQFSPTKTLPLVLPVSVTLPSTTAIPLQTEIEQHGYQESFELIENREKLQDYTEVNSLINPLAAEEISDKENRGEIMTSHDNRRDISPEWIPEQHYNVYTCSTVTPSSQSVLQLRQYYTNLEQSTKLNGSRITESNNTENNHNNTERKSIRKLRRNTFDKSSQPSSLNSQIGQIDPAEAFGLQKDDKVRISVEELRKLFESGAFNDYSRNQKAGETTPISPEQNENSNHLNRSQSFEPIKSVPANSVEFHSRPPKFRTPSPKPCNLPTPPPLPLPPSMEFVDKSYEITNESDISKPRNKMRHKNKNYSSCWSQPAKPILSMSLPYRSRSLALDRKSEPIHTNRGSSLSRYRACSITQRSLSPLPSSVLVKEEQLKEQAQNTSSKFTNNKNPRMKTNTSKGLNTNLELGKQNVNQALVHYDEYNLKPDQIVCVNPSSTDGVYVRSAVVYERVNDKPFPTEPKNFITTYVVSKWPSPSQATVQATNLWVAEQSLQQYRQKKSTPYRSQTISKSNTIVPSNEPKALQPYDKGRVRSPVHLKKTTIQQKDRSPVTQPRIKFDQCNQRYDHVRNTSLSPQPLPTPPPSELHPQILRCTSGQCSPTRQRRISQPCISKPTHLDRSQFPTRHRPYLSRSWSVKSLSPPPPFRSQWLSSMSHSRSRQKIFDKSYSLIQEGHQKPCGEKTYKQYQSEELNRIINCTKHRSCVESHRVENARRFRDRQKKQWVKRAEEISEDRLKYHELRGSWSPPGMRSPPRLTPNNMEECTEREIQRYVRQHSPPARSPRVAFPRYSSCYPQEYVKSLDKGIQCDSVDGYDNTCETLGHFMNDCVDTTPIAEDFDRKRAYFEELIRVNRNLAQCSFCSDCYHCSPGQTPKLSAYSSWDSEINNLNSQNNLLVKRDCYTKNQATNHHQQHHNEEYHHLQQQQQLTYFKKPMQNLDYSYHEYSNNDNHYSSTKYQNRNGNNNKSIYPVTLSEPQQYASNTYLPFENHVYVEQDSYYPCLDKSLMSYPNISSTKHDYYAKAMNSMPKVAPNPPTYSNNNYSNMYNYYTPYESVVRYRNISPLCVELEGSPNLTSPHNPSVNPRSHIIRKTNHSPPCRFSSYATNQQHNSMNFRSHTQQSDHQLRHGDSLESLHCEQNEYAEDQLKYYGRVKQIVQVLDKQAAEFNSHVNPVESVASPNRHRPLRRSHSDRFSYLMPRTSW